MSSIVNKYKLENGGMLLVRTEVVAELAAKDLESMAPALKRFEGNRLHYLTVKGGTNKALIAGLVRDFQQQNFTRDDVIKWCAIAGLDYTEHEISAALAHLAKEPSVPLEPSGKGAGTYWTPNFPALDALLR